MHLLRFRGIRLDIDENRGKKPGNCSGSEKNIAEQFQRSLIATCRDRAHVPDHAARRVEVGGGDKQAPSGAMTLCNSGEQFGRDLLGDQPPQRPGIDQALGRLHVLENVARVVFGIGAL